ncbi:Alpha/Beta hydrolase protein [Blakeslea trispora]|nr:Alpha/Beta hydrolase protein [Blakeslea trispora]
MLSQTVFVESSEDKVSIEVGISTCVTSHQLNSAPGIIIAHPYGPLGGNRWNNVVIALQRYFSSKGYVVFCLNFRGCGKSKGKTSWTGMPERQDYQAVIDYALDHQLAEVPKVNRMILCGYSFGAMIASTMTCTHVPCAYLLISIPLGVLWALATTKASFFKQVPDIDSKHMLCVHGGKDQFTRSSRIQQLYPADSIHIIEEADHFWFDLEFSIINVVAQWDSNL